MNTVQRFEEKLPPIDAFKSAIKHENIPVADYEIAHQHLDKFGCHTLKE